MEKAKGRSRTAINRANYDLYVSKLRKAGKGFPVNKSGDANIAEIARQCDFGRDRLYQGSKLHDQFKEDLKDIGLEGSPKKNEAEKDDFNAKRADQKSKDASVLQAQLDVKVQELSLLREQHEKLKAEFDKLKRQKSEHDAAMDELEMTGRRGFF